MIVHFYKVNFAVFNNLSVHFHNPVLTNCGTLINSKQLGFTIQSTKSSKILPTNTAHDLIYLKGKFHDRLRQIFLTTKRNIKPIAKKAEWSHFCPILLTRVKNSYLKTVRRVKLRR